MVSQGLERGYLRSRILEDIGYRVMTCGDPSDVRTAAEHLKPDIIVVELGKDTTSLREFVRVARDLTPGLVVVVGTNGDMTEVLGCLEAGADDVCPPRVSTQELDLRLRALTRVLRRQAEAEAETEQDVLRVGEIEIDPARRLVTKRGVAIGLSPTEFRLLVALAENAGRVVPSKALIARVWGEQYAGETHYLRLYVRYLRQKIEDDPSSPTYILNRWGAGYAIEGPPQAA